MGDKESATEPAAVSGSAAEVRNEPAVLQDAEIISDEEDDAALAGAKESLDSATGSPQGKEEEKEKEGVAEQGTAAVIGTTPEEVTG